MSEQVRRWGSIGVLSTIGATLLASAIIWLFKMVTEVKPLMSAVEKMVVSVDKIEESNRRTHDKIIRLIEEDKDRMIIYDKRIHKVEILCEIALDNEKECETKDFK